MPITLTLHSFEEKQPKHNEEIVFVKRSYGYFEEFVPHCDTVEYCWFELGEDEKESWVGQCCYDSEKESHHKLGDIVVSEFDGSKWKLRAMVSGAILNENFFWMHSEDYHNTLPYKD